MYLDEFCYKFNRRKLDVFERLMFSCVSYKNEFNIEFMLKEVKLYHK